MSSQEASAERFLLRMLAVVLLAIGGVLLWVSLGSWSQLFRGYQDSHWTTYLVFGAITFFPGVALIVWSWRLARPRVRRPSS